MIDIGMPYNSLCAVGRSSGPTANGDQAALLIERHVAAASACSRSATMSSMCSMPIDSRNVTWRYATRELVGGAKLRVRSAGRINRQ